MYLQILADASMQALCKLELSDSVIADIDFLKIYKWLLYKYLKNYNSQDKEDLLTDLYIMVFLENVDKLNGFDVNYVSPITGKPVVFANYVSIAMQNSLLKLLDKVNKYKVKNVFINSLYDTSEELFNILDTVKVHEGDTELGDFDTLLKDFVKHMYTKPQDLHLNYVVFKLMLAGFLQKDISQLFDIPVNSINKIMKNIRELFLEYVELCEDGDLKEMVSGLKNLSFFNPPSSWKEFIPWYIKERHMVTVLRTEGFLY